MSPPQTRKKDETPNILAETKNITSSFAELSTESTKICTSTLVFFDIEATGLAEIVGKENVQITEISMIAVGRNEFSKCKYPDLQRIRIAHKLSLCIKPKFSVSQEAAELTGLCDENLKEQQSFNKNTANVIVSFLSHLPKPVCLLAHNGKLFDFPLLKAEFQKINVQLPSDFLIVDTLVGFRSIGIPDLPLGQKPHKDVKFNYKGIISCALRNLHLYFFYRYHTGSHSSEGDCIALAKVCHKLRDKILPWIDKNYDNFDSVTPMW